MKTTIDIPAPLYKQAKIHAIETGQTLKELVVSSLSRELGAPDLAEAAPLTLWQKRRVLPEFARAAKAGAFRPGSADRDVTELISEDRDGH